MSKTVPLPHRHRIEEAKSIKLNERTLKTDKRE
jgi:hypothetical protein